MLSRREVIGKAAVGAAVAVAVGGARAGVASVQAVHAATSDPLDNERNAEAPLADSVAISSPPPWDLVSPLAAGAVVAHGWRLVDLSPVQNGSCVATLENARGHTHRIHLCRNDGTPQGLVYTRRVDLVVMNQGYGELPTEEGLGQAVAALAHAVAANEATAADGVFAELLPHAERVRRFASVDGTVADGKLR
jgi:hypothetical protein